MGGTIGVLITCLVLRWVQPALRWKQILLMLLGWTIGSGIGLAIAQVVATARIGGSSSTITLLALWVLGIFFGAGGGAGILWQLRRLHTNTRVAAIAANADRE